MPDPDYFVDFRSMMQYNSKDLKKQRPVKRGKPGERGSRPNDQHFNNPLDFMLGEFRPVGKYEGKIDDYDSAWLGHQFSLKNNKKPPTVQQVKDGLMRWHKMHLIKKIKQSGPVDEKINKMRT